MSHAKISTLSPEYSPSTSSSSRCPSTLSHCLGPVEIPTGRVIVISPALICEFIGISIPAVSGFMTGVRSASWLVRCPVYSALLVISSGLSSTQDRPTTLFSAYPATGSLSCSTLKRDLGIRAPSRAAPGCVTGITVAVAIPSNLRYPPVLYSTCKIDAEYAIFQQITMLFWAGAVLLVRQDCLLVSRKETLFESLPASRVRHSNSRLTKPCDWYSLQQKMDNLEMSMFDYRWAARISRIDIVKIEALTNDAVAYHLEGDLGTILCDRAGPQPGLVQVHTTNRESGWWAPQNLMNTGMRTKEMGRHAGLVATLHRFYRLGFRRTLVTGGLGTGEEEVSDILHEIAPVVLPPQGEYTGPNREYMIATISPVSSGGKRQ
ncbi:hypothetical protein AG1IA_00050 [Rhizoctonia solani AG-1 IA]|uniref:Uncharacterized protein n=1 Tax=Thanatephorus cucumeris (strain AG1-IA) TaxID=983506 RepID=L8XA06_THACA|nr:hypothetical protein AG1IA_00050 [Rhizoctonia solani AG-1 IA]